MVDGQLADGVLESCSVSELRKCALVREGRRGTVRGGAGGVMFSQCKADDGNGCFVGLCHCTGTNRSHISTPVNIKTFTRSYSGEVRRTVDSLSSTKRAVR